MTKNKNRLDDSELAKVDENAKPDLKPMTTEEKEEGRKKLKAKLKAQAEPMTKVPMAKQAKKSKSASGK
jgi:hypothetical protein